MPNDDRMNDDRVDVRRHFVKNRLISWYIGQSRRS
jgi:hypothetical protein